MKAHKDAYRIALEVPPGLLMTTGRSGTGIAFDDSPVPAQNRSISIPDRGPFLAERRYDTPLTKMRLSTLASLPITWSGTLKLMRPLSV